MNVILKKIALLLAASALTIGFAGCADDDADSVSSSQQHIVLEQDAAHTAFEVRSNTAWTAECIGLDDAGSESAPWFMLTPSSGLGTQQVTLDVLGSNNTVKARQGRVVVTYSNGQTYQIEVMQRGLTDIECYVTPEKMGLAAAASTGNLFTVSVANRDAQIAVALKTTGATWLKNLAKSYDLSYGYSRKEAWAFAVEENQMSDARTAELEVTVKFGYKSYKYTVTVTQDGLGAPAVKTAPSVYMNCGQTSHRQTIWLEGGNKTNVAYETTWTSASQGVGTTTGWITKAEVVANELVITADPNTDDNAREGSVLIVARRPGASHEGLYATLNVQVVQAGHKAAGIIMASSEIACDYTAAPHSIYFTLLNQSETTKTETNVSWIKNITATNGQLTFDVDEFSAPTMKFREGIISLTVTNGHSNTVIASLKVRQYAPEMPAISNLPEYLGMGYEATTAALGINPLNGATVAVVGVSANWITATLTNNTLSYTVTENSGKTATDYFREGVITLSAVNGGLTSYYYITIRQYARDMAYLTTDAVNWSWYGHCNGNAAIDAYGRYVPGKVSQVVGIQNLPHVHDITVSCSNNQFTATLATSNIAVTPYSWELGNPDKVTTLGTIVTVFITGTPYAQTLTFSASAVQTSGHDVP